MEVSRLSLAIFAQGRLEASLGPQGPDKEWLDPPEEVDTQRVKGRTA